MDIKKNQKVHIFKTYYDTKTGLIRWDMYERNGRGGISLTIYIVENVVNNDVFLKDVNGRVIKRAMSFFKPFKKRTYYVGDILTTVETYLDIID